MINMEKNNNQIPFCIKFFKTAIILIVVIILAIGYFLLIRPGLIKYHSTSALISQRKEELDAKINKLIVLKKTAVNYEKISLADREKINYILPDEPDDSSLYMNIVGVANYHGLNLDIDGILLKRAEEKTQKKKPLVNQSNQPVIDKVAKIPPKVNIELELSAVNYIDLKLFFKYLESNVRIFDVNSFVYNPENGELSLSISSYFLD